MDEAATKTAAVAGPRPPAAAAFVLSASTAARFVSSGCERQLFDACERPGGPDSTPTLRNRPDGEEPSARAAAHLARGTAFEEEVLVPALEAAEAAASSASARRAPRA